MADTLTAPAATTAPVPTSPGMQKTKKGAKSPTAKKPRVGAVKKSKGPTNHPQYLDMVTKAVQGLKQPKGSSRQAILKYVMANFNVGNDAKLINSRLKLALRRGVKIGAFKQSKGTGAAGSFRLGEKTVAAAKKSVAVKPKIVKKSTSATGAAPHSPKKATSAKKSGAKSSPKKKTMKKKSSAKKAPSSPKPKKVKKSPAKKKSAAPAAVATATGAETVTASAPSAASGPKKSKAPKSRAAPKSTVKKSSPMKKSATAAKKSAGKKTGAKKSAAVKKAARMAPALS